MAPRASYQPRHEKARQVGTSFGSQASSGRQTARESAHRTSRRYGLAVAAWWIHPSAQLDGSGAAIRAEYPIQNGAVHVNLDHEYRGRRQRRYLQGHALMMADKGRHPPGNTAR
jgi:hypothetical protein